MPALPKTSDEDIVEATRKLLERKGRDGFSMNDIAKAVGIRAPSLYGRFTDRAELLDRVELELWLKLAGALAAATNPFEARRKPIQALKAQAKAYRAFAKKNPNGYTLMFDARAKDTQRGTAARAASLAPSLPAFGALVGDEDALGAARVLTPFLHGFVSMEISRAFRMGGKLDAAFERGVASIIDGLASWRRPRSRRR